MTIFSDLALGLATLATGQTVIALLAGSVLGVIVGVLPGVGPGVTIAVLLPFTYGMPPVAGLCLLLGIYVGAFYGGSVTSILIRTPGEASSIMTMLDGYPMARRGEARRALSLAFMSSFVGGIVSALLLGLASRPLATIASRFGAAETALAIVLAAVCVARAYQRQFMVALAMLGAGFFIGTVGIDPNSNELRYTFGSTELLNGLPLVAVAVGLFGAAQALVMLSSPRQDFDPSLIKEAGLVFDGFLEVFRYPKSLSKGLTLGALIGVMPAVGAALSTSLAWFWAQRGAKDPTPFGQGNPEGIIAAESANNANSGGAMITVLTLGIPGDAITAIIMGVFIVHGIAPGPTLFTDRPEIVSSVFAGLLVLNVLILAILMLGVKALARLAYVDQRVLGVVILGLSFVGAYSSANDAYFVWVAAAFAVIGWLCARAGIPTVPLILGLVMGDTLESSLRQTLAANQGSFEVFVTRPVSLGLLVTIVVFVAWPLVARFTSRVSRRTSRHEEEAR